MTSRRVQLITWLLGIPLIGLHLAFKRQPEPAELAQLQTAFTHSTEWQHKVAPDFEVDTIAGQRFHLADEVGKKVVILNSFATWCGPCRAEMPELNRFVAHEQTQPVVLLGIDSEEQRETVAQFVEDQALIFPVAIDAGALLKAYGVQAFPTTVVIGADGRIQLYQTGPIANADVAFSGLLSGNLQQIAAGMGVSRSEYLKQVRTEADPDRPTRDDAVRLQGRANAIAESMNCPCGCDDTLAKCSCATARKAKAKLATMPLAGREDAEVKTALNHEFCMKGMQ